MITYHQVIVMIMEEIDRAEAKFPVWPVDEIHAAAIVNEESGELIRAALQYRYEGGIKVEMEKEAIQTAAMAIRFLKNINTIK